MKMRLRGTTMGLLAASAILSGCFATMVGLRDFSEVTLQNNARIMTLQRGMTPEQVIEHIGPSSNSRIPNPFRSEMYPAGDDIFRAFFFYSGTGLVPSIPDSDLTPVVFKNESLDGWGWSYWESTAKQYNIRIRNR
jgi:predicted small secreted protein